MAHHKKVCGWLVRLYSLTLISKVPAGMVASVLEEVSDTSKGKVRATVIARSSWELNYLVIMWNYSRVARTIYFDL